MKKWVDQKQTEWGNIKKHFQKRNQDGGENIKSKVKMFLEELIPKIAVVNDQDNVIKLCVFENSKGCTLISNTQNNKENDAIECMIKKLQEKATSCLSLTSDSQEKPCVDSPLPHCDITRGRGLTP